MQELRQGICQVYAWVIGLYTASELKIMACASACGAFFSVLVGGADRQVMALVYLVVADYISGVYAGWKNGQFGSAKGFRGAIKKLTIFAAVGFANLIDQAMAIEALRSMAIFGFAAAEATSIVENIDRIGYGRYIPAWMRTKLVQIQAERGMKL